MKKTLMAAALAACASIGSADAQQKGWVQAGMLGCRMNPSIGFIIAGHQTMECRYTPGNPSLPPQIYHGALNTVGLDLGITAGGAFAWAVYSPTSGPAPGALQGEYVGASGDIGIGLGVGANVLLGGNNRTIALQPVSVEGSVALQVTLGLSSLQLRWVP